MDEKMCAGVFEQTPSIQMLQFIYCFMNNVC